MAKQRRERRWLVVLLGLAAVFTVVIFGLVFSGTYGNWREAVRRGGQQPADPFRIAGNLYYVGASDVASFLLTGPEGHRAHHVHGDHLAAVAVGRENEFLRRAS